MSKGNMLCCDDCFRNIAEENHRAAKMWSDICKIQYIGHMFLQTISKEDLDIWFLETRGYIVSHEDGKNLMVRAKEKSDGNEWYFCGGKCCQK